MGWQDGEPVTGAILYASHGVAGVGWVWTKADALRTPSRRGRDVRRARGRLRRGLAIANLRASPLGEKVYARMGFETPTTYRTLLPVGCCAESRRASGADGFQHAQRHEVGTTRFSFSPEREQLS